MHAVFDSDPKMEEFCGTNQGDSFEAARNRGGGCISDEMRNMQTCEEGLCECGGQSFGVDCLSAGQCFETSRTALSKAQAKAMASSGVIVESGSLQMGASQLGDSCSLHPSKMHPNDAFCSFEVEVPVGFEFAKVGILCDASTR